MELILVFLLGGCQINIYDYDKDEDAAGGGGGGVGSDIGGNRQCVGWGGPRTPSAISQTSHRHHHRADHHDLYDKDDNPRK